MSDTVHSTTLADARKVRKTLTDQLAAHRKVCRTCTTLTENRNRYCPHGWEIAKGLAIASGDIRRLSGPAQDQTGTLF